MTRYALLALSVAALTLPANVNANDGIETGSDIVVDAQPKVRTGGWLTTSGPDERGLYTASIYIGDLDPATMAGWSKMARRVSLGTALLCDQAQALPHVAGYYNAEQRACWAETRGPAALQMERAREAARAGRQIAMIGFKLR